jgi:MoaA/NifB/PqqE/SkfB family radical SAM enzyme
MDRFGRKNWQNKDIDLDALIKFMDIDITGLGWGLCGNTGDPIYYNQLPELIQWIKSQHGHIVLTTNGSHRKTTWWQDLVQHFTSEDSVTFSIDGLPENFTEYRQNADWASIRLGIQACVSSPAVVNWKYIPFDYNQNNIEQTRQLSQNLGFDRFFIDPSKRFDDTATQDLKPDNQLVNLEYGSRLDWKQNNLGPVDAKCRNGQEHFITADGYYSPCCFVADHRWYYKTQFGKHKNQYSITDHTLSTILAQPAVIEFYKNIPDQPVCQFSCPKLSG